MSAKRQGDATSPAGSARAGENAYALLLLPRVLNGTPGKPDLFLPLTLAYLLSAHISFRFPMIEGAVAVVERAFDDILRGLPKESRGIVYQTVAGMEDAAALVPGSVLVLTDEQGVEHASPGESLPLAVISKLEGKGQHLRLHHLDQVADPALRGKLAGCAQLINVQSDGFITEGHFSLSW